MGEAIEAELVELLTGSTITKGGEDEETGGSAGVLMYGPPTRVWVDTNGPREGMGNVRSTGANGDPIVCRCAEFGEDATGLGVDTSSGCKGCREATLLAAIKATASATSRW